MNKIYSEEKHLVLLGVVVKGISSHPLGLGFDSSYYPFFHKIEKSIIDYINKIYSEENTSSSLAKWLRALALIH